MVFVFNRGKISDLFILQFVYFASCKHLFYFHQFNIFQGSSKDGPDPFCEKTINVLLKWTLFLAGPHTQAIQISCQLCSNVDIKDSWAH